MALWAKATKLSEEEIDNQNINVILKQESSRLQIMIHGFSLMLCLIFFFI